MLRAWRARSRAARSGSEPGTASSARPAASNARPSAGREPQRPAEVVGEPDRDALVVVVDVEVVAGRVRRHADHQHEREVVVELVDRDAEPLRDLGLGGAGVRDDPRDQREDALDLGAGERRGLTTRSPRGSFEPRDDVGAHVGRFEDLGVFEEAEHERRATRRGS